MFPYVVLFTVPLLFLLPIRIRGQVVCVEKRNERAIVAFFAILIFLLCFRDESIGADTMQYKYHFEQISVLPWNKVFTYGYEIGFVVLYKLIATLFHDYRAVMIIGAVFSYVPMAMLYKKKNKYAYLTIIFFCALDFLMGAFSGARQSIAMAILVLAYPKIKERKVWQFLCAVLAAFCFHQSALFGLFLYPLYHLKLKMKDVVLFLASAGVVFVLRKQIFAFLVQYAGTKLYERYGQMEDTGAFTMLLIYVCLSVFIMMTTTKETRGKECSGLLNYLLFSTVIQIFASITHIMGRVNGYFLMFLPLLLAEVMEKSLPRYKYLYTCFKYGVPIFLSIYVWYMLSTVGVELYHIYPYKFCW